MSATNTLRTPFSVCHAPTGRARAGIGGRKGGGKFDLGRVGSRESEAAWDRLPAEWRENRAAPRTAGTAKNPRRLAADRRDFTFDAAGRILTAAKGRYANTVAYAYDGAGRTASEGLTVSGVTYTVGRGYNDAGNLDELVYPDGTVVDRPHDARGLLSSVDYDGSPAASFGYDAGGRETTRTFGNNLVTTTSYVTDENLLASLATPGVGTYAYSYDANRNRTDETISGAMSDFGYAVGPGGYDDEDRLVNWDRDDGNLDQSWNLSAVGDWDAYTENASTETRTHNAVHELTGVGGAGLTYDAKGNLTADHLGRSVRLGRG